MAVNDYFRDCRYNLNNLENYIYLYKFNEPILDYTTDENINNGKADSVRGSAISLYCDSVQYTSNSNIDNRFSFENTLTITLLESKEVTNYKIIQELTTNNWMVGFKNTQGDSFIMNAEFPVMVTYQYVFNDEKNPNVLTVTLKALQNIPTLYINTPLTADTTMRSKLCGYNFSRIKSFKMIEMNKASVSVSDDGFVLNQSGDSLKTIEFNPTSFNFTDGYDGKEFTQTISFQIPFVTYRYYLHYNLLEYLDNRYYGIIETTNGNHLLGGFRQGLFPAYSISTAENDNVITITLNAKYTTYSVLASDKLNITTSVDYTYRAIYGECVDNIYTTTLIQKFDSDGNATNDYYCLNGYEDTFSNYNIVSTYNKYDTSFGIKLTNLNIDCDESCKVEGLPSSIALAKKDAFACATIRANCPITLEYDNTKVNATFDNTINKFCVTALTENVVTTITAKTEDGTTKYVTVTIDSENTDITGQTITTTINITAQGQRVDITPKKGIENVKTVTSVLTYYTNQNNTGYYVSVSEHTSTTSTKRSTVTILYNDNTIEYVYIVQDKLYQRKESTTETICDNNNLYQLDKLYKGYTSDNINIYVGDVKGKLLENNSSACVSYNDTVELGKVCYNGTVYVLTEYKNGSTTVNTEYVLTDEECTEDIPYAVGDNFLQKYTYQCEPDGIAYQVYKLRIANGTALNQYNQYDWYYTNPPITGITNEPYTSENVDCEVENPDYPEKVTLYRWVDTNETICLDEYANPNCKKTVWNRYCDNGKVWEDTEYYVKMFCEGEWVPDITTTRTLISEDSTLCNDTLSFEFTGDTLTYKFNNFNFTATTSPYSTTVFDLGLSSELTEATQMFYGCEGLTKITEFPDTSKTSFMGEMFKSCRNLTYIDDINNWDVSNVVLMNQMFNGCESLSFVDLSNWNASKVTNIQDMFYDCNKLVDVKLGTFSDKLIWMNYLFAHCHNLKSVDISKIDTSNVMYMNHMFYGCKELLNLDLSTFNTSNLYYVYDMFNGCSNLQTLNVTGWDIYNVKSHNRMFTNCTSLSKLILGSVTQSTYNWWCARLSDASISCDIIECTIISEEVTEGDLSFKFTGSTTTYKLNNTTYTATSSPYSTTLADLGINTLTSCNATFFNSWMNQLRSFPDTSNVTDMYRMFGNCYQITELDLSKFNTSNVTNMNNMFSGCLGLTSIDLSSFDTSNVIDMAYMFSGCEKLTELNLSNFRTSNVRDLSSIFFSCPKLETINVTGWDISNVTLHNTMFNYCTSLSKLILGDVTQETYNWWCARLSEYGINCNIIECNITDLIISGPLSFEFTSDIFEYRVNNIPFTATSSPHTITLEELGMQTLSSCAQMFNYQDRTTWNYLSISKLVSIPDTTNVTNMNYMFGNCSGLTSLDVSNFNTTNVTNMAGMFSGCRSLTSLDVTNFNTSNVTIMNDMFGNCSGLTSLDVSNFNTTNVTDMGFIFNRCSGLTSLDVSNFNTTNVTNMAGMFSNCSGLTSIDVSNFNTTNVTNMNSMFMQCVGLTSIDLSNFDTSNLKYMGNMFNGCYNLTTLDLSNFDTSNVLDMGGLFSSCSGLTSINVTGWDISNVTSYSNMFYGCVLLTKLTVGDVDEFTYNWWCDRLSEAGIFCEIINGDGFITGSTSGNTSGVFKITYATIPNTEDNGERIFRFNTLDFNTLNTGTLVNNGNNTYTYEVDIYNEPNVSVPIRALTTLQNFCTSVDTEITIHQMPDTSVVTNINDIFSCYRTDIPLYIDPTSINTSSVVCMGRLFYGHRVNDGYLDLRSWDVSNVKVFGKNYSSIFAHTSQDVIDIRGWVLNPSITNLEEFFYYMASTKTLLLDLDTSKITSMKSMFGANSALTTLDLSSFNTSNVTNMRYMFSDCTSLTSLDLSNFNTTNVTEMYGMFNRCTNLQTLNVSGWKIHNVTSYSNLFKNCTSLSKLILGNVTQTTYNWWCARLSDASISCDIIECTIITTGGGSVDAE